jgi:hypothetical protein
MELVSGRARSAGVKRWGWPRSGVRSGGGGLDRRPGIGGGGGLVTSSLQRLGAHVALGDGPLVGLLGEQCTHQADDRGPVGEDTDHVGASTDLLVQSLLGYLEPG